MYLCDVYFEIVITVLIKKNTVGPDFYIYFALASRSLRKKKIGYGGTFSAHIILYSRILTGWQPLINKTISFLNNTNNTHLLTLKRSLSTIAKNTVN